MASHRPVITAFVPAAAAVGGTIRIHGHDLVGTTDVTVGGVAVDSFVVTPDGTISAVIAAETTTGRIAVTTPHGTTTSSVSLPIMSDAPSITVFAPSSGKVGDVIVLTGSDFIGVTAVAIGGVNAPGYAVESDAIITVIVPTGAVTGTIHLTGPGGAGVSGAPFTYVPTPSVAAVFPVKGPAGAVIGIHGWGFTGATGVTVGGTAVASFVVDSDTHITATLGSGSTGVVAVTNSHGTGTSTDTFTVVPAPTISTFSPALGPPGTVVTITGTNLNGPVEVTFDGKNAFSVDQESPTSVSAVVPEAATTGHIAVTTPGGTVTSAGTFTPGQGPVIDYVDPLFAQVGDTITVAGSGLTGATSVKVGGVACTSVVVASDSSVTATIGAATPTGRVVVTTPDGTATSDQSIAIQAVPTIASLSPSSGAVGLATLITGTGFAGVTDVSFNATPTAFAVLSATRIRATVPSGATTGTITVTNAAGTGTSASFTVL